MSNFSEPRYASYVQLCEELGQQTECRMCSGFGRIAHDKVDGGLSTYGFVNCPLCFGLGKLYPSLADWLGMLKVLGARQVTIEYLPESPEDPEEIGVSAKGTVGLGSTEEEAAARLWMEVRKAAPSKT